MEQAREHARQDLAQRIQAYSSASQQALRRKQRHIFNEAYEKIEMAGEDLTQVQKNQRRAELLETTRQEVEKVLNSDIANLVQRFYVEKT